MKNKFVFLQLIVVFMVCGNRRADGSTIQLSVNNCRSLNIRNTLTGSTYSRLIDTIAPAILSLTEQNIMNMCHFYNDIFEHDISPVFDFTYRDIPGRHPDRSHFASNIITALDIMTDIRVYRKLRLMQTAKTAGIKVPFNNNKLRILMRHLKALATVEGIDIPRAACRKHLIIERQPVSRTEYAIWMYSILRYTGTQLCLLYNTLSGLTDLHRVQCNIITVNRLNCAMY